MSTPAGAAIPLALNRALDQNPGALTQLTKYSGKTARLNAGPFSFAFVILPDGHVTAADAETPADVTVSGDVFAFAKAARGGDDALTGINVEGNIAFAQALAALAKDVRIDFTEELAQGLRNVLPPRIADVAAERIASLFRSLGAWGIDSQQRLAAATAEYIVHEDPLVPRKDEVTAFIDGVDKLRERLDRLEQRVRRL